MDTSNLKIKVRLEDEKRIYLLLAYNEKELLPENSIANVIAIDKGCAFLWKIGPPTTKYDVYERLLFKEKKLFAISSAGQLHEIDMNTGKVITSPVLAQGSPT